jgi:hypothetical protein
MWWLLTSFVLIYISSASIILGLVFLALGGNVWLNLSTIALAIIAITLSLFNIVHLINVGV